MTPLSAHPDCVYNTALTTWVFLLPSCLLLVGGYLLHIPLVFRSMPQLPPSEFAPSGQRYPCLFGSVPFVTTNSACLPDFPWYYYCHRGSGSSSLLLGRQHLRTVLDSSKATPSQSLSCMSPLMGSTNSVVVFLKDHSPISNTRWHLPPHRSAHVELCHSNWANK